MSGEGKRENLWQTWFVASDLQHRCQAILALAVLGGAISFMMPHGLSKLIIAASAGALFFFGVAFLFYIRTLSQYRSAGTDSFVQFIENDHAASIITEADGRIVDENAASKASFRECPSETLAGRLRDSFANPSFILSRLQEKSLKDGASYEDIVTGDGHMRLSVRRVGNFDNRFIWRVEKIAERQPFHNTSGENGLPVVIAGRTDAILSMNDSARDLIGRNVKALDQLFTDLPPQNGRVMDLCTKGGNTAVLVSEIAIKDGKRALYLLPAPEEQTGEHSLKVFHDLLVALVKVAPDGRVRSFNHMATSLIGEKLSEAVPLSSLMEGLGRSIGDWLSDTLSGRHNHKSEFLRLTRADREVYVQVTLNRIIDNGEPALIAVINDATELKTLEAQFVQSQKMQAIGQLAGGVAHDFNNLLTAISGHCDLLLLRHDQGDQDYSDLVQINQNANRAAALVGQLLAFSRKQTLRPETLDMRDTLADLTHLLNWLVGEKVSLTLSHDPILKPIRADKRQLEQVMMNLIVNARDAMPKGGEIRVETECTTFNEPLIRDQVMVPEGEYLSVRVTDDGEGIAPDKLPKVFEPFFTTKRTGEGTGLGLSTAYGIIKQSGGYIFVDSTVGIGTCFTLYFPVMDEQEIAPEPMPAPVERVIERDSDGVILLVEDEAPVRAFACRALRLRGYTVIEADSAEAALETLEDEKLNIDVFVTDVVMPGMDGPSWVKEALKIRPDVRVVFVSGYAEDSFGEEQRSIPNSVFLPKPFSLNDLTQTVQDQLH